MHEVIAQNEYALRTEVEEHDVKAVHSLVLASGFFSAEELQVAVELVEDGFLKGSASDYKFLFAEFGTDVVGYTCYGRVPLTDSSYDLYWIAVHPQQQRHGLGKLLLKHTELRIHDAGGQRVYAETSSRPQYSPTHAFYLHAGYLEVAHLNDFYAPGDGKLIFCKAI